MLCRCVTKDTVLDGTSGGGYLRRSRNKTDNNRIKLNYFEKWATVLDGCGGVSQKDQLKQIELNYFLKWCALSSGW